MKQYVALLAAAMLLLTGAAMAQQAQKAPVTIATMIDSEGTLVGAMMVQLLRHNGIKVNDKTEFGTPDILRRALEAGEVDLVLDYTGSGQYYHDTAQMEDVWSDAQKGYELTRKLDQEANDLYWLSAASANNTEGLAVRREFARQHNLKTVADLARYINGGGEIKLITSSSFAENVKGLVGYEQAYGFQLREDQLIILASGNTAEMLKALYEQRDGVNVSLVYGTDGALNKMDLVVLEDPKSIPPVYLPAPVLRGEMYRAYPQIQTILKPLFDSLDLQTLQGLNAQVAFDGRPAKEVAAEYLAKIGLVPKP